MFGFLLSLFMHMLLQPADGVGQPGGLIVTNPPTAVVTPYDGVGQPGG